MELSTAEFVAAWLLAAAAATAVFLHAGRNGVAHPTAWGAGVFLFLGIALPLYVIHYYRKKRAARR